MSALPSELSDEQGSTQYSAPEKKLPFDAVKLEVYLSRTLINFRGPIVVNTPAIDQGSGSHVLSTPEGRFRIRYARPDDTDNDLTQLRKEFYILATLHRMGYPVAQPYLMCEEAHVAGVPFYISNFPEGRVLSDAALIGLPQEQRTAIYSAMNQMLVRLHSFDPATLGLSPLAQSSSTLSAQIKRWENTYNRNRLGEIAEMEELSQWLPTYLPPEQPSRVVHGNFHLSKLVLHPTEPEIIGVRDWDNTAIGDPLADAFYHFLAWVIPPSDVSVGKCSLQGYNLSELGLPTLRSYLNTYTKAMRYGELPYTNFYLAYSLFRLAATMQELATHVYTQDAQSPHARLIASQVRPLAVLSLRFAEKASAS